MTFSNPAGGAAANAQAYRDALIELVGDRDPLSILAELPEWLRNRFRGVDEARARQPERPGKWSALEVLAHLADAELVHGYRTRLIVAEPEPRINGYDQDGWAMEFRYPGADLGATCLRDSTRDALARSVRGAGQRRSLRFGRDGCRVRRLGVNVVAHTSSSPDRTARGVSARRRGAAGLRGGVAAHPADGPGMEHSRRVDRQAGAR